MKTTIPDRRRSLAERRALRHRYKKVYDDLATILLKHDPIEIGGRPDEYEPEAGRILAKADTEMSVPALTDLVHSVFVEMFNERIAGPARRYRGIARELWTLLHPS